MTLKILLPIYEASTHPFFSDDILSQIRKAGIPYDLITLTNSNNRIGELPARNQLFKMALENDDEWEYCITLSNDVAELPTGYAKDLLFMMHYLKFFGERKVGAMNAYGFVNTFPGRDWAQAMIDPEGANTGIILTPDMDFTKGDMERVCPPNPELSTALCIISRKCLEEVGLFDEGFGMGGGMEHWDYAIRMVRAGFENLLTYKVRFKANIKTGNNFTQNDTHIYYREKWGTGLDGLPTKAFIEKAKTTSPSAGFTDRGRKNVGTVYTNCPCSSQENPY
jgi:GT2 family glycosyltransferase